MLFAITHAPEPEVIDDQDREFGQALQEAIVGTFSARLDEVIRERGQAQVLGSEAAATGMLAEGLCDKALAGTQPAISRFDCPSNLGGKFGGKSGNGGV